MFWLGLAIGTAIDALAVTTVYYLLLRRLFRA